MKIVGAFEAKTHLSQLLIAVENGETITITKHGKAVAILSPIISEEPISEAIEAIRTNRKGVTLGPNLTIKKMIEEGRS